MLDVTPYTTSTGLTRAHVAVAFPHNERRVSARIDGASEQPAQQAPHAGEQALEQAEDAGQQAADDAPRYRGARPIASAA
jgi:hypothetical protein